MDVDGAGLGVGKGERLKAIPARKCDVMRPEKSTDSISQAPYLFFCQHGASLSEYAE